MLTEMGQIAGLIQKVSEEQTPYKKIRAIRKMASAILLDNSNYCCFNKEF